IVTATDVTRADIGIADGTIARIGQVPAGEHEMDATNLLILPGGIDAHVHLSQPPSRERQRERGPRWVDNFTSGSAAALAGGITTLGNMTFPKSRETPMESLARETALV